MTASSCSCSYLPVIREFLQEQKRSQDLSNLQHAGCEPFLGCQHVATGTKIRRTGRRRTEKYEEHLVMWARQKKCQEPGKVIKYSEYARKAFGYNGTKEEFAKRITEDLRKQSFEGNQGAGLKNLCRGDGTLGENRTRKK